MFAARVALPGCAALIASTAAAGVNAQTADKPLAEALFQHGRELLAAGKTHEACAKFAMSHDVEPKLGTLLNLAACHETEGKTASAWAEFRKAIALAIRANDSDREAFAREHAEALGARLSRVSIVMNDPAELTVRIDGATIDRAAVATPFPIDPGSHVLEVSGPAKKPWKTALVIPPGPATTVITVPELFGEPAPAPTSVPTTPQATILPVRDAPTTSSAHAGTPEVAPWIALGVGAAAVGVGTYFGIAAFMKKDDAETECDGRFCSQAGLDSFDEAEAMGTASTVAFGVGLVAIGVGTYLLLRSAGPPRSRGAWLAAARQSAPMGAAW